MARAKSEYLGAYGTVGEILKSLVDDLLATVGDKADSALDNLRDKDVRRKVVEILVASVQALRQKFTFTVDYSRSLAEMIAAGRYDWTNSDINAANFPIKGEGSVETEGELFHFNRNIGFDEAIREMDKDGYRPATIEELLAFGAKHPELQRQFPIIALGSVWQRSHGLRNVADLGRSDAERDLYLRWIDGGWYDPCRFLAVRKSSSR